MAALMEVTQADRDFAADYNRILSRVTRRDADAIRAGEWDDTREVQQVVAHRLAHSEPRPVAGEVQMLRETLIKMGRMLPGVQLDDRVSSDFLTYLPVELEAALAAHSPAPTEAGEVIERCAQVVEGLKREVPYDYNRPPCSQTMKRAASAIRLLREEYKNAGPVPVCERCGKPSPQGIRCYTCLAGEVEQLLFEADRAAAQQDPQSAISLLLRMASEEEAAITHHDNPVDRGRCAIIAAEFRRVAKMLGNIHDVALNVLATHSPAPTEAGLKDGEWFYPEGDHSSDECRFSVDEVIDYALEGESVSQIVCVERATSLPAVYAAVRVWTDAEKDERESDADYDYTLFATAEEARDHLVQQESTHDQ